VIELNFPKLKAYAHKTLNCNGEISNLKIEKLEGGASPAQLFRITLSFEGCSQSLQLVHKVTFPNEVQAMLALSELSDTACLPELIDYSWNPKSDEESANWFITPFYAGTPLTFQDDVPAGVLQMLARLHYHFQNQEKRFGPFNRVDKPLFENTLANAVKALAETAQETQNPIFANGLGQLRQTQENEQILNLLEHLPVTFTQGDMHPGNLIRLPEGRTVLIDWGNARFAPAMLDLANLIALNSNGWYIYLQAWQENSGTPLDEDLEYLGYHWATIMVNTMYMPHAVRHSTPEHVRKMVKKVVEAEQLIDEILRH